MLLVESNLQKQRTWWKWYKDCPKKVIVQIVLKIKIKTINKKEEGGGVLEGRTCMRNHKNNRKVTINSNMHVCNTDLCFLVVLFLDLDIFPRP